MLSLSSPRSACSTSHQYICPISASDFIQGVTGQESSDIFLDYKQRVSMGNSLNNLNKAQLRLAIVDKLTRFRNQAGSVRGWVKVRVRHWDQSKSESQCKSRSVEISRSTNSNRGSSLIGESGSALQKNISARENGKAKMVEFCLKRDHTTSWF